MEKNARVGRVPPAAAPPSGRAFRTSPSTAAHPAKAGLKVLQSLTQICHCPAWSYNLFYRLKEPLVESTDSTHGNTDELAFEVQGHIAEPEYPHVTTVASVLGRRPEIFVFELVSFQNFTCAVYS